MTSSFLICYPDIPPSALTWSVTDAFDVDYSLENAFYGERHNYAQLAAAQLSPTATFDLGTGNSRTVDHLIIGGAQLLLANGVTLAKVQGSSDGVSWVNQLGTASAFQTRTFVGPDGDDVIFKAGYNDDLAGTLAAYRYFKVSFSGGAAHKFPFSKLYFGASFDMGKEPDNYDMEVVTEQDSDTWKYPRGHTLMTKAFHPRHKHTVEWDGVTDAKATEFMTSILANPYRNFVFLHAGTYADPLYSNTLIYAQVMADECTVTKSDENWNDIKAVFLESI
jgi:hypothetical protein